MTRETPSDPTHSRSEIRSSVHIHARTPNGEQRADAPDAEHRSERQDGKRDVPPHGAHPGRDSLNRECREQEAERRLHRERGADRVSRHALGDEHAELRRVSDHEKAPREGDRYEQPETAAKSEPDQQRACSTGGHGPYDEALAANAIRDQAGPDAAESGHGHDAA